MTESVRVALKGSSLESPMGTMGVPLEFDPTKGHCVDPSSMVVAPCVIDELPTGPPVPVWGSSTMRLSYILLL